MTPAEKVVKVRREHAQKQLAVLDSLRAEGKASEFLERTLTRIAAEDNAWADFVLAAEGDDGCICTDGDPCTCGAVESRERYDASLARLAEVLGGKP